MPETTIAAISAAEKSILDSKLVTIIAKGTPLIEKLVPVISTLLFGVQDSKEMQKLREIYGELGKVDVKIDGLPDLIGYYSAVTSVRQKIRGIHTILEGKRVEALRDTEFKELCDFLTPGLQAHSYTNYKSCVANLLDKAYGAELNSVIRSQGPYPMGNGNCAATAINNNTLSAPVTILRYLEIHMNFAVELAALILATCLAANDAYTFLRNNREAIQKRFDTPQMSMALDNLSITLADEKVKADIGDTQSPSFLSKLLMPSLATAPAHLCGVAYRLVGAMMQNADSNQTEKANTQLSISHAKGAVVPENSSKLYNDRITAYPTEYAPGRAHCWVASFSNNNNTEASYINLAGRHGGFLGMVGNRKLDYVYEITRDKHRSSPVYQWDNCIWELRVRHDKNKKLVFMFVNRHYSSWAMANNHGLFMPTDPGIYEFQPDNPDQYWTIEM